MKRIGQVRKNPFVDFDNMPKVKDKNMRVLTEKEYRSLRDVVRSSY
jgi:hypothetical protein